MEHHKDSDIKKTENKNNPAKKNYFCRTITVGIVLFAIGLVILFILLNIYYVKYPYI